MVEGMGTANVRGSLADRILTYLARNKGERFRAYQIAQALRRETQPVANECARLARKDRVTREGSEDRTQPTWYSHKG